MSLRKKKIYIYIFCCYDTDLIFIVLALTFLVYSNTFLIDFLISSCIFKTSHSIEFSLLLLS